MSILASHVVRSVHEVKLILDIGNSRNHIFDRSCEADCWSAKAVTMKA